MKLPMTLTAALFASTALADSTRELDSHEHGVGELSIAIEGGKVAMEFHAPGADIVGFEYEAKSEADLAAVASAVEVLENPLALFEFSAAAGCTVDHAHAALEGEDAHEEEHGHDDHDHDDHKAEESHSEFHAEYELTCADTDALTEMSFPYFDQFENAREIEIQIVANGTAKAFEVERGTASIGLN